MTTIDYAMYVASQCHHQGRLAQAEIILGSILESHPEHAYALHLSGIIAYQSGKIMAGIKLIERAIASREDDALFHSNLAEMYRKIKSLDLSIQHGTQAIALDPASVAALSNLGISYFDAEQYDKAEECHQRALTIDPAFSRSLNNMGSIRKIKDMIPAAISFYRAAILADATFAEPLNNLGALLLHQQEFAQSVECLRQAIQLAPNYIDAHCNLGFALTGLDRYNEALLHFEKALQCNPEYVEALFGIAKVYFLKLDFEDAESHIRKALAINLQQLEFHRLLSEIHYEQGDSAGALMCLEYALSLDPADAATRINKGTLLMEMGKINEAREQFSVVADDSGINHRLSALYSLVQLSKIDAHDLNLKALLSIADNLQQVSQSKQMYFYFAMGKCYDDMGEWGKAFKYFTQGCKLKRKAIQYHSAGHTALTNNLMTVFNREAIDYLRQFSNPSVRPIFIVGMPRSGTTLVEQILASHPDVHGAGELPYFINLIELDSSNITLASPEAYLAITEKYLAHLSRASSSALRVTDKMPQNFLVIGLIHALFPNASIIHVKRNPLDTCLSCYTKLFSKGQYFSYDLAELGHYYQCYEKLMKHWQKELSDNAWLDVCYEDIVGDIESQAKKIVAYCNLSWDPACLSFYESKRNIRTASFMQVRKPVYSSSINRWKSYESELGPLINQLSPSSMRDQIQE